MGSVSQYESNLGEYGDEHPLRLTALVLNQWENGEMPGWYFLNSTLKMAESTGDYILFDEDSNITVEEDEFHSNITWIETSDLLENGDSSGSLLFSHYDRNYSFDLNSELSGFHAKRLTDFFNSLEAIMMPGEVEKRDNDSAYRFRYTEEDLRNLITALDNAGADYLAKS